MICSKIVNFDRTEAGLTSKWGRISPAVQWCYQNQSNYTVRRRTSSYDEATLHLMAPMDFWRNSTPFWCKASLCTLKIDNFRIYQLGHHMFCSTNKKTASFWWANEKTAGFFMSPLGYRMICSTNKKTAGFDWPIRKQQVFKNLEFSKTLSIQKPRVPKMWRLENLEFLNQ